MTGSTRRALFAAALAAALLLGVSAALPAPARLTSASAVPVAPRCDWDQEFLAALRDRGETPSNWQITPDADGPGAAWTDLPGYTVTVSRASVACVDVRSVVNHEWMHLQQARYYGGQRALDMYQTNSGRMEIVADCGSKLLGSTNTPFVNDRFEVSRHGCRPSEIEAALELINHD